MRPRCCRLGLGAPRITASVFVFSVVASIGTAWAADEDSKVAIQDRRYTMAHEFSFTLGSMPLDPYQKGWTAGFGYTVHLSDYFAWEVLNANLALLTSTDLRDELINTFAIPEEDFAAPRLLATTGIEFSPVYGKSVLLNGTTIHQAIFAGVHAGLIFGGRYTMSETIQDFRPTVGVGLGYRVMLTTTTSVRIDFRDYLSFKRPIRSNESVELDNVLLMTAAISFNLWRDDA